jgi:hypothetical protein
MTIDEAGSVKRTDIVHPLCDFLSVFASLVPEAAQVPRAPPDASLQDPNGKQVIIHIKPEPSLHCAVNKCAPYRQQLRASRPT